MNGPRFPDVMVLAAGLGTRMLPLSAPTPKPLLQVAGKKLLDRVVGNAHAEGATKFVVNAHPHADQMKAHVAALEASIGGTSFALSLEPEAPLGTGGGIRQALPLLDTDPFLVMNADAFWPLGRDRPLTRMLEQCDPALCDLVLLCVHPRDAVGFRRSHDFCLDPHGRVTRDTGAPVIYGGVALVARAAMADEGARSFYPVIERCLDTGRVRGVALAAPWFHVGDPRALEEAEDALGR